MSSSNSTEDYSESSSSDDEYYGDNGEIFYNEVLNKKYITIKKIGYGAYSSVWLCMDYLTNKFYAIKIQNSEDYKDGILERNILNKLKLYNNKYTSNLIESFIEVIDKEKYICLVFELCACNLYSLIKKKYNFGLNDIKKITKQLFLSLYDLHELEYYHTDIKPENILLNGIGDDIQNILNNYTNYNSVYKTLKEKIFEKKNFNLKNKNHLKKFNKKYKEDLLRQTNKIFIDKLIINNSSSEEDDNSFNISDKFLKDNLNIKLTDYGTVHDIEHGYYNTISTRYYRAPEVILGLVHNEKVDIWSIGCVVLELLTNEIFFNPKKDKEYIRDFYHLLDIQKYCGKLPEYMINKSPDKRLFFSKKNKFKMEIDYSSLKDYLIKKDLYSDELLEFLNHTLNIDYKKRLSAHDCLKLKWLN